MAILQGVLIIALSDGINRQEKQSAALGNFYCFLSAVLYGFYGFIYATSCLRVLTLSAQSAAGTQQANNTTAEEDRRAVFYTNQITGFIGLMTLLFQWILIPILHWTGLETVEPLTRLQIVFLLVNTCSSVLYNTLYMVDFSLPCS